MNVQQENPEKPQVAVCLLPKKMRNLSICMEMGNYVLFILEQYPHIKLIRDNIIFISNKISSHIVCTVEEMLLYIEHEKYSRILVLKPRLAKKAPSQSFYGEIILKLKERNYHVDTIECAI